VGSVVMAHFPKLRLIFAVPVISLLIGGALTLILVVGNSGLPAINHQPSTINLP